MSLIIPRNYKRAKAQDSAAMDATPLHSSYNDPWWVEEAGKTVQALRNGGLPRKSIEELYAKIGRYTIGGGIPKLHSLAEKLNDLKFAVENNGNEGYKARQKAIGVAQEIMRVKTADSRATDAQFKVGDRVRVDASYSLNVNNGIGKVVKVDGASDIVVEFAGHGTVRVPVSYATLVNSRAGDSVSDKEREYTRLYELAQKNITFHAAKGDSAKVAEWKRKADEYKRLAQEAENAAEARNAKDSCAADANFKVGDRVKHAKVKSPVQPIGKISEVYNDQRWVEVEWENMPYKYQTIETSNLLPANSHAADACGTDAKFQKGDKVRVWQHPVYGKLGEVVEATYGGMEYTVNVEGKDYPRIDYRYIVRVSNAAGDAAEFHVGQRVRAKDPAYEYSDGKALGAGMFTVKEVNNNGDVKLDDYGDVWISPSALVEANDACGKRSR